MQGTGLCTYVLTAVVLLGMVANGVAAAPTNGWVTLTPASSPPGRASPAMAFDERANRTILYGGITEFLVNQPGETWAYDAGSNNWTNRGSLLAPSGQYAASMVYDSRADRVVLFGGSGYGGGWLNDTWAYDYNVNAWTQLTPSLSPPGRNTFGMVYDSRADRIVLFGGWTGVGVGAMLSDTWVFDYNRDTWTNVTRANGPSARTGQVMAYDSGSDQVLMYGGVSDFGDIHDTWTFDLGTSAWRPLNPSGTPFAVRSSVMVYEARADRTILFGGYCLGGLEGGTTATWAFNNHNNSWSVLPTPTSPPCLNQAGMVYDSGSDAAILFGGSCALTSCGPVFSNATWAYRYPGSVPAPGSGAAAEWILPVVVAATLPIGIVGAVVLVATWIANRQRVRSRP